MEILFATDGSEGSAHALNVLCDLPLGSSDHVTVLSVPVHQSLGLTMDGISGVLVTELIEAEEQRAKEVARHAARRLTALGMSADAFLPHHAQGRALTVRPFARPPFGAAAEPFDPRPARMHGVTCEAWTASRCGSSSRATGRRPRSARPRSSSA